MLSKSLKILVALGLSIIVFNYCNTLDYFDKNKEQSDRLITSISKLKLINSLSLLEKKANSMLDKDFKTVIDKSIIAPSRNKNDYTSRAIYYWPKDNLKKNSTKDEIWEYVDGKVNKESLIETDHNNYYEVLGAIKTLALSFHLFQKDKYAEKTVELIKNWFINKKTRMNPHFNYAQAIPGKNSGTPSGIIDARGVLWVVDAVNLISKSTYWNDNLDLEFRQWTEKLFEWLLKSDFGIRESQAKNNHGTFYDLQIIKLSSFLGEYSIAENYIDSVKINRIAHQIEPNGFQTEEMKRTKSNMYAVFNLSALLEIATIARTYEHDLWNYKAKDSGSIKDAVDYLLSNADYKNQSDTKNLLRILPKANELSGGKYNKVINKIKSETDHIDLTDLYFVN